MGAAVAPGRAGVPYPTGIKGGTVDPGVIGGVGKFQERLLLALATNIGGTCVGISASIRAPGRGGV